MTVCKICASKLRYLSKETVLKKYEVDYFQCSHCGFVQTEAPYWLDEAYSSAITQSDVGLVDRNLLTAQLTQAIITVFFNSQARFLDYGAGYGLFVRLMRDRGFDFYYYDKYSTPLFAGIRNADPDTTNRYELLTAFEVFEHLVHPLEEIKTMLQLSNSIFFSTTLLPENNPGPQDWWYYGLEHGQHVVLYTQRALEIIAEKFGLNLYSQNNVFHILTPKTTPKLWFSIATNYRFAKILNLLIKRNSLIADDYQKITGHLPI